MPDTCASWKTWRWGEPRRAQLLRELGRSERPENAHALLLEWGAWDVSQNPYPARLGLTTRQPEQRPTRTARSKTGWT